MDIEIGIDRENKREREREGEGEGEGEGEREREGGREGGRGKERERGGGEQGEGEPGGVRVPRSARLFASAEESRPACAHRGEPNRSGWRGWGGLVRTMRGRPRGCWRAGWAKAVCSEGRSGAGAQAG